MTKEVILHQQNAALDNTQPETDFTNMFTKDVFIKGVFMCAIECIFFINIVKTMPLANTLQAINLKPFDLWRLLNSFIKFDPLMPRNLNNHFREIEVKIVTETAWTPGSPVLDIVRELCRSHDSSSKLSQQEMILQPYNLFFKRLLHLAAERIKELGEKIGLDERLIEKIWEVMKMQLSTEPQLLINR